MNKEYMLKRYKFAYEVYANIQLASPDRPYNKKELDHIKYTINEWYSKWSENCYGISQVRLSKFNYPTPKDWYPADTLEDGYEIWVGLTFEVREIPIDRNFSHYSEMQAAVKDEVFDMKYKHLDLNFFPNEQTIFDFCEGEYKGKEVKAIA